MSFNMIDLWASMGPMAKAVMLLLLGMSLLSLAVAIERIASIARSTNESAAFLAQWRATLAREGPEAAAGLAERFPHSHAAWLVREGAGVLRNSVGDTATRLEAFDRTARRIVLASGIELRKGLGLLATVGSTAPFVGLFGTVLGIVSAFRTMGVTGQGGLGSVATGISEALVATALGILVAIPALWVFNYLTQRIQRCLAELECVAEELAVESITAGPAGRAS
ncbi:MAG: MotA/TolQ/ExbB proton channel family protein [Alphaproteobacteria bacterium]